MQVPITIELPFQHRCKDCTHFHREWKTYRAARTREILGDFFSRHPVNWERVVDIKPNLCRQLERQVDPEAQEKCFEWQGSHEEWLPEIHAKIVDEQVKVTFE